MSLYGLTSRTWVLDYTTNAHTYRLLIFKDLLFRNRTAVLVSLHRHQHRSEIMKHSHQFVKHFFKFIFQSTAKLKCPTNPLHRLSRRLSSRETRLWTSPQLLSIGISINSCFLFDTPACLNLRRIYIPQPIKVFSWVGFTAWWDFTVSSHPLNTWVTMENGFGQSMKRCVLRICKWAEIIAFKLDANGKIIASCSISPTRCACMPRSIIARHILGDAAIALN